MRGDKYADRGQPMTMTTTTVTCQLSASSQLQLQHQLQHRHHIHHPPPSHPASSYGRRHMILKDDTPSNTIQPDQRSGYRHDSIQLSTIAPSETSRHWSNASTQPPPLFSDTSRTVQFLSSLEEPDAAAQLPAFVRPLPSKIAAEDVGYLFAKGALTLPAIPLQNALLQAYVEYVHPYMPLMDLHNFLGIVNSRDGLNGQCSLFLYHAVMFAATAFVDMKHLREAGYSTRKAARKAFFQKTRVRGSHCEEHRGHKLTT